MSFPDRPLRLGTRASPLAIAQAELVKAALLAAHGWANDAIVIVPVVASGDKVLDRALAEVGGKALWTKELDHWLLAGETDFSVHSMKDVETVRPDALTIAAMPPRADPRDRIVGVESINALPQGARLGTSAPRRSAQLLRLRADLEIVLFRGNVQTRLRKLADGEADATLLAAAGLDRLGMFETGHAVPTSILLPAPSQGAIGVEARSDASEVLTLLSAINDVNTHQCVSAERALLARLQADCRSPVAAHAVIEGGMIRLRAEIYSADGREMVEGEMQCGRTDQSAAAALADDLLRRASRELRATFG